MDDELVPCYCFKCGKDEFEIKRSNYAGHYGFLHCKDCGDLGTPVSRDGQRFGMSGYNVRRLMKNAEI